MEVEYDFTSGFVRARFPLHHFSWVETALDQVLTPKIDAPIAVLLGESLQANGSLFKPALNAQGQPVQLEVTGRAGLL